MVNGRRLRITHNLSEALRELRRSVHHIKGSMAFEDAEPGSIRIWIDAICIDQKNTHERVEQVRQMGLIFRSARKVFVWLGPEGDSRERVEMITRYAQQGEEEGSYLKSFQDGAPWTDQQIRDLKYLCNGLRLLTERPWFHRLWVIQEVVLAKESPILMVGEYQCSLSSLTDLWVELADLDYPEDLKDWKIIATFPRVLMMYDVLRDWYRSIKPGKSPEEQLSEILPKVENVQSTLPHDMLYGFLALVAAEALHPNLRPDYGKPYEEVYWEYSVQIILRAQNLAIITRPTSGFEGMPTWVADFRKPTVGQPGPTVTTNISFSADMRRLFVEGAALGSCISAYRSSMKDHLTRAEALRFQKEILKPAAARRQGRTWEESFREFTEAFLSYTLGARKVEFRLSHFQSLLRGELNEGCGQPCGDLLAKTLSEYWIIVTDGGVIGIANQDSGVQVGDELVILKGAHMPFLLRATGDGKDSHRLVGPCMVAGELKDEEYGTEFFAHRTVSQFTLV
ncbi:hypothetical protein DL770_004070 [Monosporascus sp. CRB-9-2]|nr:hypothetical protein DL770_004070 [Monosporascus sp. CRB-9-2]